MDVNMKLYLVVEKKDWLGFNVNNNGYVLAELPDNMLHGYHSKDHYLQLVHLPVIGIYYQFNTEYFYSNMSSR